MPFKKRSHHLVDLLTPVHPWLAPLVTANPPPLKLAQSQFLSRWPPAPAAMGAPVQSLAVQGAVPGNVMWSILRHFGACLFEDMSFLAPGSCTPGALGSSQQLSSRGILILVKFITSQWAYLQVVSFCSLVSELFSFSL